MNNKVKYVKACINDKNNYDEACMNDKVKYVKACRNNKNNYD